MLYPTQLGSGVGAWSSLEAEMGREVGEGGFVDHFFGVLVVPGLSNHVYFIGTASSQNGLVCSLFLRLPSKPETKI